MGVLVQSHGLPSLQSVLVSAVEEHSRAVNSLCDQAEQLKRVAERIHLAIVEGHAIFWCGNGGSAADSQHLAAEFVGRFRKERRALRSVALTTDTSVLTSVANDYGFEQVFARQIEALCQAGDVVVGISTSGESMNVAQALKTGKRLGAFTVAMTGSKAGRVCESADISLAIQSASTARIQEAHILAGHVICEWVEAQLSA